MTDQLTGRALDAAVAEQMGFVVVVAQTPEWSREVSIAVKSGQVACKFCGPDELLRYERFEGDGGCGFYSTGQFHPSTDWTAAAEVLEAARALPFAQWFEFYCETCRLTSAVRGEAVDGERLLHNLTPEIICRAFLSAKGDD
jgi:hypothetical protein